MKVVGAAAVMICLCLPGCAEPLRGDADQVYISSGWALTDAQGIDAANKHCANFGKTALYRGQYSAHTKVFACIILSSNRSVVATDSASALRVDAGSLHLAADQGDADAMFKLGVLYSGASSAPGHLPPDYAQSMLWFRRAADHGNSNAMAFIGTAYIKGQNGLTADQGEAVRWLRKASSLGNAPAMYALSMVLDRGAGRPTDQAEAMQWFLRSAQLGQVDAMTMSGVRYISGKDGQVPDYVEAMHWFRSAADKGDAASMFMVGDLYRYGLGVPTDFIEAMRWSLKAAQAGNPDAMKLLGEMYEKGLGVSTNNAEALRWYQMAAKQSSK
jgi:TPR repeat protein